MTSCVTLDVNTNRYSLELCYDDEEYSVFSKCCIVCLLPIDNIKKQDKYQIFINNELILFLRSL